MGGNKHSPLPGTPLLLLEQPGMLVPVSPEISMDLCVGISSRRGEDVEELLIYIPRDAPINPLLPKARQEWERLCWALPHPLTA